MHRHSSLASQVHRKRAKTTGFCFRVFRLLIYVGVIAAALCSMLLIPAFLSTLRSRIIHSNPVDIDKIVIANEDDFLQSQHIGSDVVTAAPQPETREPLLKFEKQGVTESTNDIQLPGNLSVTQQPRSRKPQLDYKMLWKPPPNRGFEPCASRGRSYKRLEATRGYLVVHANGGLNQMRAGICDMVAVARLINATLVIPELDKRSFWQDSSTFSDVFDEEYFIKALEEDVPVVKTLPENLTSAPKARKQFTSWSSAKYYQEEIVQLWDNYKVIHAAKADSRLANNNLPPSIQKLRCRVHYEALRFAPAIEALGKTLVERMRSNGPFIALHLRYEKDMLAFSGCTYDLSDSEIEELTLIRENTPHWKVKVINSTEQRLEGLCPLTPKEVGIFLRALGYPSTTRIYIAAGEIYGNNSMEQLRARFPNLMSKETVATKKELRPFRRHATQLAALDYIVSVESDVFVPTYSGNMARAVEGHRRFLGHRKTISPDRKQLVGLFDQLDEGTLQEGEEFSLIVKEMHVKRQGAPRKRRGPVAGTKGRDRFRTEEAFYTNPLPDCLCQKHSYISNLKKSQKVHHNVSLNNDTQMLKS